MLDRLVFGQVPAKHHTALRDAEGRLAYEECITRDGFDGPYTLLYHRRRPQALHADGVLKGPPEAQGQLPTRLVRRHYRTGEVRTPGKSPFESRVPLLFNADVILGAAQPSAADETYVSNGDGDELVFVLEGSGTVRSILGDLRYQPNDYVFLPRGILHRILPDAGTQRWFTMEFRRGVGIPQQWRNPVGQLRMDAPYCERDFRLPEFRGPLDEGIRALAVKKNDRIHAFRFDDSPLDVIGWDGAVFPFAFPILSFQPRVGLVHLPPTWHGTFAGSGALVCSFVPRPVDFHPQAIPCPYPHANVDVDEVIFYCSGNFTSRRGVGPGSVSFHPAGVAHGPHPNAYEKSIGTKSTEELAVMLDVFKPLAATEFAQAIEDPAYQESFGD